MTKDTDKAKPATKTEPNPDAGLEKKAGLVLVLLLIGAFSYMAWQKWNHKQKELLAENETKVVQPKLELDIPPKQQRENNSDDPFAEFTEPQAEPNEKVVHSETPDGAKSKLPRLAIQSATDIEGNIIPRDKTPHPETKEAKLDPFGDLDAPGETKIAETPKSTAEKSAPEIDPFEDDWATETPDNKNLNIKESAEPANVATLPETDPFGEMVTKSSKEGAAATKLPETTVDPFANLPAKEEKRLAVAETTPSENPFAELPALPTESDPADAPAAPETKTADFDSFNEPLPLLEPVPQLKTNETPDVVATTPDPFADFEPVPAGAAQTKSMTTVQLDPQNPGSSSDAVFPSLGQPEKRNQSQDAAGQLPTIAPGKNKVTASFPETEADPNRVESYKVKKNDNYWSISKTVYGTSRYYRALAAYNKKRISDPQKMQTGMQVLVPHRSVLESSHPEMFPQLTKKSDIQQTSAESAGMIANDSGGPVYRVGQHDTLSTIAQNHLGRASRWIQIYELNRDKLSDPNQLKIGTLLNLPSDASRVKIVR